MGLGGRVDLDALGFDHVLTAAVTDPLGWRVIANFVNWAATMKLGMVFGVVFAAALLTLLQGLSLGTSRRRWINTLKGIAIGAPLGVCANCAAPIGQGLQASGERVETVTATIISSPSLNVVVLALVFGLFPFHFAATKVALTVVLLLAFVPLLAAWQAAPAPERREPIDWVSAEPSESWTDGLRATLRSLIVNLRYIARTTVPLMVLSGLLGALVVEWVPLEALSSLRTGGAAVALVALVGTLLPVPITFDVIVAFTLWQAGLSPELTMILLFTLGTYSVYPAAILWQARARRVAVGVFASVMGLGMLGGLIVGVLDARAQAAVLAHLDGAAGYAPMTVGEQIHALCEPIPNAEAALDCVERLTIHVATDETGPTLCETLPEASRPYCLFEVRLHHALPGVLAPDAVDAMCLEMVDPVDLASCRAHAAVRARDPALCPQDPTQAEACAAEIAAAGILATGQPEACEALPEADRSSCRLEIAVNLGSTSASLAICDTLDDRTARHECQTRVRTYAFLDAGDPSHCAWFADEGMASLHEECLRSSRVHDAVRSGDPAACVAHGEAGPLCLRQMLAKVHWMADRLRAVGKTPTLPIGVSAPPTPRPVFAPPPRMPARERVLHHQTDDVLVYRTAHSAPQGDGRFAPQWAESVGLTRPALRPTEYYEPFIYGRGVAAGDIDGDGRTDLVFALPDGVSVHQNDGGSFSALPLPADAVDDLDVFEVALVDLDNDGALDLYLTAYGGTNRILYNDGDRFRAPRVTDLPRSDRLLTMATGFGDLDRDGDLDMVLGNWSFGSAEQYNPVHSANEIAWNRDGRFELEPLDDVVGETLSVLLTDYDADGWLDLFIANDGPGPDQILRGGPHGLSPIGLSDGVVPNVPWFSMSWDAGDLDNDLDLDLFGTEMSFGQTPTTGYCAGLPGQAAAACTTGWETREVVRNYAIDTCEDPECEAAVVLQLALDRHQPALCERLPPSAARALCRARLAPEVSRDHRHALSDAHLPQVHRNVLLVQHEGTFTDGAETLGARDSWWSWNARFVDVDADGWTDLFVGNGYALNGPPPGQLHSNVLFLNQRGRGFAMAQQALGLTDIHHAPTWVFQDLDQDGDLDWISPGVLAPPRIAWNGGIHRSLSVRLADHRGNRSGIGARVIVHASGGAQVREIRASGGFLSHEAPIAHFGLGTHRTADRLEVRWPDGEVHQFQGPLPTNQLYSVERLVP